MMRDNEFEEEFVNLLVQVLQDLGEREAVVVIDYDLPDYPNDENFYN